MGSNLQANFSKMATIKQDFAIKRNADRESMFWWEKVKKFTSFSEKWPNYCLST